ncbi:unnamed protein product [Vicia faba]|uniref:Reverse transcriptase/retrotransposon-derived protein RNase H-like domain-containing protein n=1 Tax=Vicia faba TaxID=3906 RepID=A0AAV0Z6A2_VICFA|nr:unnamed protein product [Vicia faba]
MINQAHNLKFLFRPPFQLELHRRGPLGALVTGWVTLVHRRANRVLPVYSLGCLQKVLISPLLTALLQAQPYLLAMKLDLSPLDFFLAEEDRTKFLSPFLGGLEALEDLPHPYWNECLNSPFPFGQASKVSHSIISYLTFLTVAVTARLLCSATPCFIFEWKRKAIFSYGLRDPGQKDVFRPEIDFFLGSAIYYTLVQEGPSKLDHPTHCLWGRRLSPTERNYTITEREGLTWYILYRSFDISY